MNVLFTNWGYAVGGAIILAVASIMFLPDLAIIRNLRGVLPLKYSVVFGLVLLPGVYTLVAFTGNYSGDIGVLYTFIALWLVVLLFIIYWMIQLLFASPASWVSEGIIFATFGDFKSWRKNFLILMSVPLFLMGISAAASIGALGFNRIFTGVEEGIEYFVTYLLWGSLGMGALDLAYAILFG